MAQTVISATSGFFGIADRSQL